MEDIPTDELHHGEKGERHLLSCTAATDARDGRGEFDRGTISAVDPTTFSSPSQPSARPSGIAYTTRGLESPDSPQIFRRRSAVRRRGTVSSRNANMTQREEGNDNSIRSAESRPSEPMPFALHSQKQISSSCGSLFSDDRKDPHLDSSTFLNFTSSPEILRDTFTPLISSSANSPEGTGERAASRWIKAGWFAISLMLIRTIVQHADVWCPQWF